MPAQSGVQFLKATTAKELHEIYRFRYKIYVQEMHRMQHYANHELKEIVDPLDCGAVNFFAAHQTKTIGILRLNFCRWSEVGYYETLYAMHTVGPDHPEHTSICTRLMIIPELRGSTLAVRMCILAYTFALARGIKHNFIDCNDHLVPFFSSLGYVAHTPKTTHPEYGLVNPMHLNVLDSEHLAKVRSPFLRHLEHRSRSTVELVDAG